MLSLFSLFFTRLIGFGVSMYLNHMCWIAGTPTFPLVHPQAPSSFTFQTYNCRLNHDEGNIYESTKGFVASLSFTKPSLSGLWNQSAYWTAKRNAKSRFSSNQCYYHHHVCPNGAADFLQRKLLVLVGWILEPKSLTRKWDRWEPLRDWGVHYLGIYANPCARWPVT